MRTALTLYPHRCLWVRFIVSAIKYWFRVNVWGRPHCWQVRHRGAKVSPQAELVCTLEEKRLFSDMRSKQQQIGSDILQLVRQTQEEELWRKVGKQGQMLVPHLLSNWTFPKDGRQKNFQLPWQTASLGFAVTHHQDSFLKSSHHHLTYLYLQVPPQSDIFLLSLPH